MTFYVIEVKHDGDWHPAGHTSSRPEALGVGRNLEQDCPGIVWRVSKRCMVARWLPVGEA